MAKPPSLVSPAPMEGAGGYNQRSRVQAGGSLPALPLLEKSANAVVLADAPAPIVIADYGAAGGHNSLAPMAAAIAVLRRRAGAARAISVVHTDVSGNDFGGLFRTLESDSESYLRGDPAVFASAVGRSFYEQVLPAESVTLGWSSWAVQWLSRTPSAIPDQIQVSFSRDAAAHAAFEAQAAADWRRFLTHRAQELRPGGRLVVVTMALTEARDFGYRPLLAAMYDALLELKDQGFVSEAEVVRMVIPTVGRSRADFLAPFQPSGVFAGLRVEHAEVFLGEDRIWASFEQDRDAAAFGARWAAFPRASVFPTLAEGLEGGHGDPRHEAFIARMEAGTAARMAAVPQHLAIQLAILAFAKSEKSAAETS
jgi:SAM dependent carboxyl methyltransferase